MSNHHQARLIVGVIGMMMVGFIGRFIADIPVIVRMAAMVV
ncbi:hypothetical protein [Rhizobium laguerreae]|nr:hypothetical protein [Rhizobium laguerreae]